MLQTEISQTPKDIRLEAKIYMTCGFLACTGKAEVGVDRVGVASMALPRNVSSILSHALQLRGLGCPF